MLVGLKKIRINRGLTLKELSKKTGISTTYINELELLYKINPSEEKVEILANILNVSKEQLKDNLH